MVRVLTTCFYLEFSPSGYEVLVRAKLALSPEGGVTMQLSVRSDDAEVSELVASAVLSKKNVGFYARHLISRTETRNYVGQFYVYFLESDKMLGYWLSFYVNRLERTHFVILAELSPKKPTLISILSILDLMIRVAGLAQAVKALECKSSKVEVRFPDATFLRTKNFFLAFQKKTLHFVGKISKIS